MSSKDDIRKLMKERQSQLKKETGKRIDSPLASYDSLGRLSCVICKVLVKNESLWSSHLIDKLHKEKIELLKKSKQSKSESKTSDQKRKNDSMSEEPHAKHVRLIESNNGVEESPSSLFKKPAPVEPKSSNTTSELPLDFFDSGVSSSEINASKDESVESKDLEEVSSSLPTGFFDNPQADAQARNEIYVNPQESEWEEFQKVIQQESEKSSSVLEEDLALFQKERDLNEVEEQLQYWQRLNDLERKKQEVKHSSDTQMEIDNNEITKCSSSSKKDVNNEQLEDEDEIDDDDDDDLDNLMNWRNKPKLK